MVYLLLYANVLLVSLIIGQRKSLMNLLLWPLLLLSATQFSSLMMTGNLIEPLALTNTDSINKIGIYPFVCFFSVMAVSFIFIFVARYFFKGKRKENSFNTLRYFFLFLIIVMSFSKLSPVGGMATTLTMLYDEYKLRNDESVPHKEMVAKLLKKNIYYNSNVEQYIARDKYNVIVLFIEGLSYDVISKEVTPNIHKLMDSSVSLDNYYNHTAATFRGLRGQLTSSFQITGGVYADKSGLAQISKAEINEKYKDSVMYSLSKILSKNGYSTYFQSPHATDNQLASMLEIIGFDRVFGSDDLSNESYGGPLSDKDSFSLLSTNINNFNHPFFYGLYTYGTHLGQDSPDAKYDTGGNEYLNKFHNLDVQLGTFIENFNNSALAKNTLIIFTSDHSSYPSKELISTFNTTSDYFVDKIPFVVYKKGLAPSRLDVAGLNTLSFAPTVLDILGIKKELNIFLGLSVFEEGKREKVNYMSALGSEYFSTSTKGVERVHDAETISELQRLQQLGE